MSLLDCSSVLLDSSFGVLPSSSSLLALPSASLLEDSVSSLAALSLCSEFAASFGSALPNNGVMHANFAVTRNPEIPSCLVETDFVSSPAGEESIWNPVRRKATAEAIAAGIADWCGGEGQ